MTVVVVLLFDEKSRLRVHYMSFATEREKRRYSKKRERGKLKKK